MIILIIVIFGLLAVSLYKNYRQDKKIKFLEEVMRNFLLEESKLAELKKKE
jgi:hypothetical protein